MTDAKKEALELFAAKLAKDEEIWRRDNPGKARFYLLKAPDEPPTFSEEGQHDLREVMSAIRDYQIEVEAPFMTMDAVDAIGGFTGEIAVLIKAVSPTLVGMFAAWLRSKAGRKVRLKMDDIEVEATTVDEVKKLLQHAKEIQARQEGSEK